MIFSKWLYVGLCFYKKNMLLFQMFPLTHHFDYFCVVTCVTCMDRVRTETKGSTWQTLFFHVQIFSLLRHTSLWSVRDDTSDVLIMSHLLDLLDLIWFTNICTIRTYKCHMGFTHTQTLSWIKNYWYELVSIPLAKEFSAIFSLSLSTLLQIATISKLEP